MSILISHRRPTPDQAEVIRLERAEAGALETVIDFGRGTISTGTHVMSFAQIAFPVRTLRRRVDAAIQRANTGSAGMVLEPRHYAGRAKTFAAILYFSTVQGRATLAEIAGKSVAGEKEADDAWMEYCTDAGSTLAHFGMSELVI